MIFEQKEYPLKYFGISRYICDEIFLSHDKFRNYYRHPDETTSFANDLHSWLLKKVIRPLEREYGAIRFEVVPVRSKDQVAFCAVHVSRTSDRIFANMVHRAMIDILHNFDFVVYYRLQDNEILFEEGGKINIIH